MSQFRLTFVSTRRPKAAEFNYCWLLLSFANH